MLIVLKIETNLIQKVYYFVLKDIKILSLFQKNLSKFQF